MNRSRSMRIALLATTALVAAVSIPVSHADVTVSGGTTLDLGGATVFHNNLILEDGFLINGTFNASESFDVSRGGVDATLTGLGTLFKTTTETVTLTGANTYTGGTSISAGILRLTGSGTLGTSGSDLSIGSGGTLDLTNTTQTVGTLTMTDNASLIGDVFGSFPLGTLFSTTINASTSAGTTALIETNRFSFGTINKSGAGTLRLDAPSNFFSSGVVELNAGVLDLGWQGVLETGTVNAYDNTRINYFRAGQNHYNQIVLHADSVKLTADSGVNIVQHGVISDGGNDHDLEIISDTAFILTADNTYTGVTTFRGLGTGTLLLGYGGATGSIAGDLVLDDAYLTFLRTADLTYAGAISGFGSVDLNGTATITLSGNNTYSAGTNVSSGTLKAGSATAFGTGHLNAAFAGATIDLNGFDISTTALLGAGTFDLDGQTLTVTGGGSTFGSTFTAGYLTVAAGGNQAFDGVDLSPVVTLAVDGRVDLGGSGNVAPQTIALGATGQLDFEFLTDPSYVASNIFGAGSIALGGTLLEAGGSNANATLSGTISGVGGSLKKVGTGTLTLSGNNTFTGGIEVAGGTLSLASNGAAGLGSITTTGSVIDYGGGVDNAAPIVLNSNTTQLQVTSSATQSGVISETGGSRPLEKIGNGVLTMTAANTYTGTTTISAGRIILSGAGEILGNVHIANNSPNDFFQISKNSNYTYGGVISGYNVALTGTGTTTWTGANTHAYTGIADGTLTFSGAGTLGASNTWVLMSGGTVDLNGTTQSAGIFTLYDGGTGLVTNGNLNVSTTFYADSGTMAANLGGTATLAKFSGGTSVLSGTNTYTGQTFLNGGTLIAQGGSAIANTSAVNIASGATLQIDNDETIGSLAGAGNVSLGSNTLTSGGTNAVTTFSGALAGTGGLTKVGTADFYLTGANTYTGLTTVVGGRMKLGNGGAIAGNIQIVDNGQAWFDFDQSGSYTYSGVLSGGQVAQTAPGTTTLTGLNSNNYLGIGGGTVTVSGGGTFGASNMSVGISGFGGMGTLDLGGTTQNISLLTMFEGYDNAVVNGTLNVSSFLFAEQGLISADLAGTATLVKNGGGTTILSGFNTYTGQTAINSGTLVLQGGDAIDNANAVTIAGGATLQLDADETVGVLAGAGSVSLGGNTLTAGDNSVFSSTFSGVMSGTGGLVKLGTGHIFALTGANTYSGLTDVQQGTLALGGTTGSLAGDVHLNSLGLGSGLFFSRTNDYTFGGAISGNGEVRLSSNGTTILTLTGVNTHTGITRVDNGTLVVAGAGTLGANTVDLDVVTNGILNLGGSTQTVGGFNLGDLSSTGHIINGTLNVSGSMTAQSGTISANLSGAAGLFKTTAGTVTLSGTNSYSGPTNINGGTLRLATNDAAGTGAISFGVGSTLRFANNVAISNSISTENMSIGSLFLEGAATLTGNIGGSGGLAWTGSGPLTITGNNTFSGDVFIGAFGLQTLIASGGNAIPDDSFYDGFGLGTLTLLSNETINEFELGGGTLNLGSSTFTFGNANDRPWGGTITGDALSSIVKQGTSKYTFLDDLGHLGTTVINGGEINFNGTAAGSIIVNSGGKLSGTNTIIGDLSVLTGGVLASGNSPGTTTVLGNYTGGGFLDVEVQFDNAGAPINGVTHDFLDVSGNVSGAPTTVNILTFAPSATPAATVGNGIQIVRVGGTTTGSDFTMTSYLLGSYFYDVAYVANYSGSDDGYFLQSSLATPGCSVGAGNDACFVDSTTNQATPVNALGGNDTLQLTGATNFNFDVSTIGTVYTNFEVFQKADTSTVTLTGVAGLTTLGFDVQNGTLIAGTNQLGSLGRVNVFTPGTLEVSSDLTVGSIAGTGTINLAGGDLFTGGDNTSTTFSGILAGSQDLLKVGSGTLTLSGANTNTGLTWVLDGTLQVDGGSAIDDLSRVIVDPSGTLRLLADETIGSLEGTLISGGTVDLGANTLTLGGNDYATLYLGPIIGTGGLTKVGNADLTLGGTNTYTGATQINGGTLTVEGGTAISDASAVSIGAGGTLVVNNSEAIGSLAGVAGSLVNLGSSTLTAGGNNSSTAFGGVISGTGDFEKQGSGTLTLSGANTFTGNVSLFDGGLTIAGAGTLGASTVDLFVQGTLDLGSTTQTVGSLGMSVGSIQNGSLIVNGSGFAQDGVISADLTVTGGFSKAFGSGSLTLSGTNTLSSVGIGEGTLVVANDAALTDTASVNMSYIGFGVGPTLQINTNQTIGSVSGDLFSAINLGSNLLTTGGNNASSTFNGFVSGSGGLTKTGTGTFTLAGTGAYTGATNVNGGTLAVSGGSALSDSGNVVVSSGAVLNVLSSETIGSLQGAGNVSLGGSLTTGGNNVSTLYSGSMSGAGQLVKAGTGAMTLTGANTHTGGTNITGGILQVSGIGTLGASSGSLDLSAGAGLDLGVTSQTVGSFTSSGAVYNGTLTVTGLTTLFAGNASANLNLATLDKSGAGAATLSGTNTTGAVNVLGGSLVLSGGSAISDSSAVSVAGGSNLVLTSSETIGSLSGAGGVSLGVGTQLTTGGNNSSTTLSGAISGNGKLVKTGSGLFTLGGLNSFTGGIDLMQGGIRLLNSNAAGTGPITTFGSVISYANAVNNAAPIIVNSNTTQLEVLAADVAQQSGVISEIGGPRPIEKIGTGTLTLSGANTYTGATTITAGTLNVTGGSALSNSAAVNIGSAGTLSVSASESVGSLSGSGILNLGGGTLITGLDNSSSVFSGSSTGGGGLTKSGTGTMTLTGSNSFGGALTVANGNLTITPSGTLNGMVSFNVLGGASAFLGGSVQGVNGGGMTGAGFTTLSVNAGGTMYLDDNTSLSTTALNLASGSNLNLFLTTNTSQYPQISVTGANITNANVGVYLDPISFAGTLATSFTYSNVISGTSVTGTFGSVNLLQSPSGLFTVAGIYSPTSAGIQVTRNAFSTLGGGGSNGNNVGDAIEDIFTNGPSDPDIVNLITVIGSTPGGGIPAIYAAIVGAENSENTGAGLRTDDPWKQSVAERVNAARTTGCTVAGESWCLRRYAQASTSGGEVMSDVLGDPTAFDWLETGIRDAGSTSVWGRAIGAWGESQGDVNGPGSTQWTGGMIAGADRVFSSLLLAGVAMQYVETSVDFESSENKSTVRSGQFGAYVSYGGAEAFVNGNVSLIGTQASANRYMSIGLLDYDVHSFARSWALTASVEGGTIMEYDGYRFEPSVALNYQGAYPVDFRENGGGGLSLIVHPDDSNSLRSILSARVSRVFDLGDRNLVPQLRVDWRHEMLDRRQEFSAAFAGDPTVFFDVDGATYARDVFSAGASLTMPITGRVMGYVDAQGAFSEDSTSAMVSLGGRATW